MRAIANGLGAMGQFILGLLMLGALIHIVSTYLWLWLVAIMLGIAWLIGASSEGAEKL